jgi:hypothetical protein
MPERTYHILNLGAGVQSTALYLMSHRQDEPEAVPRFDYAIFADTQEEPKAVYDHLAWLQSLGGPPILVGTAGKLGDDLLVGMNTTGQANRLASIPAFTGYEGDKRGITRRQCTKEYKVEVIERVIRREILKLDPGRRVPKDVKIIQYFGLSFDEPRRIISTKARVTAKGWSEPRFPLFDLEITRFGCQRYNEHYVPHPVPRSACVFCPYKSNAEWRRLRDTDPTGWERACQIDEGVRAVESAFASRMDQKLYVHSSCRPLRQAPIDTPESRGEQYTFGFASECEGMCGV